MLFRSPLKRFQMTVGNHVDQVIAPSLNKSPLTPRHVAARSGCTWHAQMEELLSLHLSIPSPIPATVSHPNLSPILLFPPLSLSDPPPLSFPPSIPFFPFIPLSHSHPPLHLSLHLCLPPFRPLSFLPCCLPPSLSSSPHQVPGLLPLHLASHNLCHECNWIYSLGLTLRLELTACMSVCLSFCL